MLTRDVFGAETAFIYQCSIWFQLSVSGPVKDITFCVESAHFSAWLLLSVLGSVQYCSEEGTLCRKCPLLCLLSAMCTWICLVVLRKEGTLCRNRMTTSLTSFCYYVLGFCPVVLKKVRCVESVQFSVCFQQFVLGFVQLCCV